MGYPYKWQVAQNQGIKGPAPMSMEIKRENEMDSQEVFYTGFNNADYKTLIRSSLQRILLTKPGERVMLPEFGCDLEKYLFEPGDEILEVEIKAEIANAIATWEPRIRVTDISIRIVNHTMFIEIPYQILGTDTTDVVNYVVNSKY